MKKYLEEMDEYLKENPDFQEILQIFGETMETYREAMSAIDQRPSTQTSIGRTSTIEFQQTSLATTEFELKTA